MKKAKTLTQKAACRVDFAGGTVDLWPLYLYLGDLELVHMGIRVQAEAKIRVKAAAKKTSPLVINIESLDLNRRESYLGLEALEASLAHSTRDNPLRWVNRVVAHQLAKVPKLRGEIEFVTRSDAPPGSGLGGSSTLGIAIARGLEKILLPKSKHEDSWKLQQSVRNLEAIEIEHPAGDQDYVPALFGGLLVFHLGVDTRRIERLPASRAKFLGDRCALLYTGKPHHSGLNNWQIFQDFHNRNELTRTALLEIRNLSSQMAASLRKGNPKNFGEMLNQEWALRQKLSPAVTAPVLDEAWDFARALGASGRKACGAGGGGCLLVYFDDPRAKKSALAKTLPDNWKWLDCQPA